MEKPHRTPVKLVDPAAQRTKRAFTVLTASTVGLELGVAVIVSLLFGMWLDKKLGTEPWLMLLCLVIGLIAGFRNVFRAVARAQKAVDRDDEDGHG